MGGFKGGGEGRLTRHPLALASLVRLALFVLLGIEILDDLCWGGRLCALWGQWRFRETTRRHTANHLALRSPAGLAARMAGTAWNNADPTTAADLLYVCGGGLRVRSSVRGAARGDRREDEAATDLSSPERKLDGLGFVVDQEDAVLELVAIHEHISADSQVFPGGVGGAADEVVSALSATPLYVPRADPSCLLLHLLPHHAYALRHPWE